METQLICVLTCHRQVCFAITQLLHNKRKVLQGKTDKHLDKLNKASARCLGLCIYIWVLKADVQGRWFVWGFASDLWNW